MVLGISMGRIFKQCWTGMRVADKEKGWHHV